METAYTFLLENTSESLPNWAEVVQAIIGTLTILFTFITIIKLLRKDKDMQKQIEKLAQISEQLSSMVKHNQRIFEEGKKPHITSKTFYHEHSYLPMIAITNINPSGQLTRVELLKPIDLMDEPIHIQSEGITQKFYLDLRFEYGVNNIKLKYIVDNMFIYIQEIDVFQEDDEQYPTLEVVMGMVESI